MSEHGTHSAEDEKSQQQADEDLKARDRGRRRRPQHQPNKRAAEPLLNLDELRDLVELIATHGFTDFELEREGIRVRLRRELAPQPGSANQSFAVQAVGGAAPGAPGSTPTTVTTALPPSAPHPGAQAEAEASVDEGLEIITSPIVGTFYRSPSPTANAFVNLGSKVDRDTVVCIIEAMKLMNEIQAEIAGEVAKIYVENGQAVEFGQPLFGIRNQ